MEAESSTRRAPRTRSTRTATTKKRKSGPEATGGSAPKRARVTKKAGCLAGLLSISLDVVFEIFGNLQPLDLLRLSRTSKEFRNLLMHRSSITVWRSSLSQVPGLPPCPPGMNEPQWISLAFDPTCQVCQKIARKVDWALYVRICGKCTKSSITTRFLGLHPDKNGVNFRDLIPTRPDATRPFKSVYFSVALENVKAAYNAIQDGEEKKKFVEERKERVQALKEHAKLCEIWSESVAENRSTELADLKEERYLAVAAKLTALGWGPELDSMLPSDSLRSHKTVRQPHALTERTWNTMQSEMVQYMEHMKAKRLAREHVAIIAARKTTAAKVLRTFKRSQLPWTDIMPGPLDFDEFPKIKEILSQPAAVDVDEQTFEALLPEFPAMIATWREGLMESVIKVYKYYHKDTDLDDEAIKTELTLATSAFKCNHCADDDFDFSYFPTASAQKNCRPMFWPRAILHHCTTHQQELDLMFMQIGNMPRNTRQVAWRPGPLGFDKVLSEKVEKIVVACGMDPKTTTVEQMDAADARLACHVCAQRDEVGEGKVEGTSAAASTSKAAGKQKAKEDEPEPATARAYSWRNAVRHHAMEHWRVPTAWHMLTESEAAAARILEAVAIEKNEPEDEDEDDDSYKESDNGSGGAQDVAMEDAKAESKPADAEIAGDAPPHPGMLPAQIPELAWSCAHCLDQPQDKPPISLDAMKQHLLAKHSVLGTPKLDEDYYRAPAAPEVYNKEHFPSPKVRVMLPPCPSLPKPPPSRPMYPFMNPFDDFDDSDDEMGMGYDGYDSEGYDGYDYGFSW
ncbi:hypothetical protein C8F04DRAFT_1082985 [Mycena alexandri]|uniref:F-box domain-containing protein n=1 Tax=Mycena alexandri TaxID=1745969 RepID=A0AAD6X9W9_9AGAR|nr:hypothetical protein C8F04DRAFT_1082985 [Mycena alexandri]